MIDCRNPDKLRVDPVPGLEITKIFETDPETDPRHTFYLLGKNSPAEKFSEAFANKPRICNSLAEMTDGIDAGFINCCSGDGELHLELARPFLEKGIPLFVDKPLASNYADAKKIVELAEKYNTPLFSASILQYVREAEYFRNRLQELDGPLTQGVVKGISTTGRIDHAAIIHGVAFSHTIFGSGVKWVECMGECPLEYMLLGYENDLQVVLINSTRAFDGFRCEAHSRQGWNPPRHGYVSSYPVGDPEFIGGALNILREFKSMIQTRKQPLPYADMLELIAIIDAGKRAHAENRRVTLEEIIRQ